MLSAICSPTRMLGFSAVMGSWKIMEISLPRIFCMSASDTFSGLIVIIGVRLSSKESDSEHPYGHERFECVAALLLSGVLALVGGSSTLPRTVVLNRRGEVVYNKIGSVTPEMLSALFDEANRQQ